MNLSSCLMCKNELNDNRFDITKCKSKFTKTLLRDFIENVIIKHKLFNDYSNICKNCLALLNDYDYINECLKAVQRKILSYLDVNLKAVNVGCQTEENLPVFNINNALLNTVNSDCSIPEHFEIYFKNGNSKEEINAVTTNLSDADHTADNKNFNMDRNYPDSDKKSKNDINTNKCDSEIKPSLFLCEICGLIYKQKYAFKVHIEMHNGKNRYTCSYCNKSFTQQGSLMAHAPIHTGETPHMCDLCGKTFSHKSSLSVHILRHSHSGEKNHQCVTCKRKFFLSCHLTRHLKVHDKEKKYVCTICNKRFRENYNLKAHQKIHANDHDVNKSTTKYNFQCQICLQKFTAKSKYLRHLSQKHQIINGCDIKSLEIINTSLNPC